MSCSFCICVMEILSYNPNISLLHPQIFTLKKILRHSLRRYNSLPSLLSGRFFHLLHQASIEIMLCRSVEKDICDGKSTILLVIKRTYEVRCSSSIFRVCTFLSWISKAAKE
ncbi:hypothetical protein L6452_37495 [Arctium lappa]|uniref:Uncharacterized protein n=1 Tax=Arctium lappa TaxID=4217 RepID=A0ACB8Y473_ARCLA|nr:hypothetical protein L6452_37495 [Arctium lappa]